MESGKRIHGDALLYAVGRQAATDALRLDNVGIATDARGRLTVNESVSCKGGGDGAQVLPNVSPAYLRCGRLHWQGGGRGLKAAANSLLRPACVGVGVDGAGAAGGGAHVRQAAAAADVLPLRHVTTRISAGYGANTAQLHHPRDLNGRQDGDAADGPKSALRKRRRALRRARKGPDGRRHRRFAQTSSPLYSLGLLKLLFCPNTLKLLGVHAIGENASEIIHLGQVVLEMGGTPPP
jgi:NAD(P) transhydrogenase